MVKKFYVNGKSANVALPKFQSPKRLKKKKNPPPHIVCWGIEVCKTDRGNRLAEGSTTLGKTLVGGELHNFGEKKIVVNDIILGNRPRRVTIFAKLVEYWMCLTHRFDGSTKGYCIAIPINCNCCRSYSRVRQV